MTSQQPTNTSSIASKQSANTFKTTILSVDLGRTATKACVSREANRVVFVPANVSKQPVQKVRGGDFEARPTDPLLDMWLEYQGSGYAVGQLAADFGAKLGVGKSKVEDAPGLFLEENFKLPDLKEQALSLLPEKKEK